MAKAQDFFDDTNDRFHGALAQAIDSFTNLGLELVGHLFLRTGIFWRGCGQFGKIGFPTSVMRFAPSGDVRVNASRFTGSDVACAKVAIVQRHRAGRAQFSRNRVQSRLQFTLVIGVAGECVDHNQETVLIHGDLYIVMLVKALIVAVFHNARLGVGEVVLVLVARPRSGGLRDTPTGLTTRLPGFFFPCPHFGFILGQFGFIAFLRTDFHDGLGLG